MSEGLKLSKSRIQDKNGLKPGPQHIHIAGNTELVLKHHGNWRQHSIQSLQFIDAEDLHYSACVSLTQADAFRVKEMILENLKHNVDIISQSASGYL